MTHETGNPVLTTRVGTGVKMQNHPHPDSAWDTAANWYELAGRFLQLSYDALENVVLYDGQAVFLKRAGKSAVGLHEAANMYRQSEREYAAMAKRCAEEARRAAGLDRF